MMRTRPVFEALIVIFILGACAPSSLVSVTKTVPVQTLSVTNTSTSTPIPMPTATKLAVNWGSSKKCVTEYPERSYFQGIAALRSLSSTMIGLELSLLNLKDGTATVIDTSNQSVWDVDVSPDRQTLAYSWFNNTKGKYELALIDSAGSLQEIAWSSEQGFVFQDWLNDHQLIISQGTNYLVVDPYQDSHISFSSSDFPEFNLYDPTSFLSFDPSLSKAIYNGGSTINIFDLASKIIKIRLEDDYNRIPVFRWRPSGEQAAVVATLMPEQDLHGLPDEIFIVEKDGQVRQLTHLYDTFRLALTIHSLSWSPDGNKIAFWLDDKETNTTLMVADYESGSAVNYCITNIWGAAFPIPISAPIWSPDGKYLLVENQYAKGKNRVLVVDLSSNIAFPIAENMSPVGWMIENP
jgi:Tol biopolymer transport system component